MTLEERLDALLEDGYSEEEAVEMIKADDLEIQAEWREDAKG